MTNYCDEYCNELSPLSVKYPFLQLMEDFKGFSLISNVIYEAMTATFLRIEGDEYIISLDPRPAPHPQPRTHRAAAYRALAHGPQPREPCPMGPQPRELQLR